MNKKFQKIIITVSISILFISKSFEVLNMQNNEYYDDFDKFVDILVRNLPEKFALKFKS